MRERRDAGRSMEPMVILVFALALSLGGGHAWSPWGYLAGPALIVLLVGGFVVSFAIAEFRSKRGDKP